MTELGIIICMLFSLRTHACAWYRPLCVIRTTSSNAMPLSPTSRTSSPLARRPGNLHEILTGCCSPCASTCHLARILAMRDDVMSRSSIFHSRRRFSGFHDPCGFVCSVPLLMPPGTGTLNDTSCSTGGADDVGPDGSLLPNGSAEVAAETDENRQSGLPLYVIRKLV